MSRHKWLRIIGVFTMLLLLIGCSGSKSTPDPNPQNQSTESQTNNPPVTKLESDSDLKKQLEAEKGIESVMIQVIEGQQPAVNVDIVINNEQELSPDQVIEKYSKVIKEKYPDRPLDLIVVKEGKILKQVTTK